MGVGVAIGVSGTLFTTLANDVHCETNELLPDGDVENSVGTESSYLAVQLP